jgi:hypothetical protein
MLCYRPYRWIAAFTLLISISTIAAPAPFFKWRSNLDGIEVCLRTSPGHGWKRVAGPFKDLNCRVPGGQPLQRWDRGSVPVR